jgi:hypothetical protein
MAENYVVPHPQFAGDPNVVNAEWVDASKASVVHGGRRVEVTEVRIAKSSLSVRIQLQRSMSVPGIPGGPAVPTTWNDKFVAVLYDNAGSRMEQQSAAPANNRNGPPEHLEIILKFSNVSKIDGLRLEIPAAAWGGTGVVKFAIPAAMVRR